MAGIINENIPGFFGGISQQQDDLRRNDQVEEMLNCMTTITDGTIRRPRVQSDGVFTHNDSGEVLKSFYYRRDDNEQYIISVVESLGALVISRADGSSTVTVDVPQDVKDYLATPDVTTNIKAITLSDVTYIVNTTKVVGTELVAPSTMDLDDAYSYDVTTFHEAKMDSIGYVWLSRSSMDATSDDTKYTYSVIVDGTTYSATDSHSDEAAKTISTNINNVDGWHSTYSGSMLYINKDDYSSDWTLSYSDNFGNGAGYVWKGTSTALQRLPAVMPWDNVLVEIDGDGDNQFTKYYVKYHKGSWLEYTNNYVYTVRTDGYYDRQLPKFTNLPIELRSEAVDTFVASTTKTKHKVKPRLKGNEDNAKDPSFVGNTIQSILFASNRLVLLTADAMCLSAIDDFWNFYPSTLLGVKASDRIDITIASDRALTIYDGLVYRGGILLQTSEGQYLLNTSRGIAPTTLSVDKLSVYEYNKLGGGVYDGNSVIFSSNAGEYTTLYRYVSEDLNTENKGINLTLQIPSYIPKDIIQIVSHPQEGLLFLLAKNSNKVYVYKEVKDNDDILQAAWFTWDFTELLGIKTASLVGLMSHENRLYLILRTANDTVYYPIELSLGAIGSDYVYKDLETIDYLSEIKLSKWRPRDGQDVQIPRGRLQVRTAKLSASGDSMLRIERPSRNTIKDYTVQKDMRLSILADSEDLKLSIRSIGDKAFKVNTINFEGTYKK